MRVMPGADRAGAHREARGLDAGVTQRDGVVSREFLWQRGDCGEAFGRGAGGEQSACGDVRSTIKEVATKHGKPSVRRIQEKATPIVTQGKRKWLARRC